MLENLLRLTTVGEPRDETRSNNSSMKRGGGAGGLSVGCQKQLRTHLRNLNRYVCPREGKVVLANWGIRGICGNLQLDNRVVYTQRRYYKYERNSSPTQHVSRVRLRRFLKASPIIGQNLSRKTDMPLPRYRWFPTFNRFRNFNIRVKSCGEI